MAGETFADRLARYNEWSRWDRAADDVADWYDDLRERDSK